MKASRLAIVLLGAGLTCHANANLVLNGSFEINTATTTMYNLTNAQAISTISYLGSFGSPGNLDLMQNGSNPYGSAAAHGQWKLGLTDSDRLGLLLESPLVTGQAYDLSFFAQAVRDFNAGTGPIYIALGDLIGPIFEFYSTGNNISSTGWENFSTEFVAPFAATAIYVRSTGSTWSHMDDIQVSTVVPEPGTILLFGSGLLTYLKNRTRRESSIDGREL